MTPAVEAIGATVAFDGVTVLDSVDLRIEAGEFVALLGANGAGKTTLVNAILGLVPLAAGRVLLDGQPPERDRDGAVALVPQRLPALGAVPMSVGEVVAAGRVGRWPRWPRTADRNAVARALDDVDLSERRRSRLDHLSGGQQRRVLIARALAGGARTLFLDEPTAGVDAASQQRLADLLGRLSESGATVILVTHELGPLAPLVTRTVVLAGGRVAYDGPTPPAAYLHDHVHHHDQPFRTGVSPLLEPGPLDLGPSADVNGPGGAEARGGADG
ncbi:MAG: metal ABC transporter ATP-binding protein [Candidatus Nanopelagicales bacterium]